MIQGFRRSSTRRSVVGLAAIAVCAALAAAAATAALADPPPALFAGGTNGIVFAHGAGHGKPQRGGAQQLVYHNGPVMTKGANLTSIFWGSSWADPGDKITGIDSFYAGFGGSHYAATNTEYTDTSTLQVSSAVTPGGHVVDLSTTPAGAPSASAVLAVVARNITPDPSGNGYYPVYSDQKRGNAGYCAWHSWGTIGGVPVQFAFFFNLDGDPGCDPNDTSGLHTQALAALANVSGHELSEALTDPHINAWYDTSGNENADKCAWKFSSPLVTFANGSQWKIQGNWSNAASGCIDTK
jgi:hypothetical protein